MKAVLKPYAEVIGDPIFQSKSPLIHNFWLEKLGLDAEYRAMRIVAEDLEAYFARRCVDPQWRGCNVTIPHKTRVLPLVADTEQSAAQVGAINCIYAGANGLVGANSDVDGVLESLAAIASGREVARTCLIGAGGAARAALQALRVAGLKNLCIIVRDPDRAHDLLKGFGMTGSVHCFEDAEPALTAADTVINASPLGMLHQQPMPPHILEALALTAADALIFDMVYAPLETPLLARARSLGRNPVDGLNMLIGQADQAFRLFFKARPPRQFDAELRTLLTAG